MPQGDGLSARLSARKCSGCGHGSDDHHADDKDDPTLETTRFACRIDGCECADFYEVREAV